MCHSSFDCIDCSKRFETPADYKGHTSCISEAEKYQKKLYSDGVSERVTVLATANLIGSQKQNGSEGSGRHQRSRPQGGGRQWGNNRSHWQQQNVHRATGANDTPLGTPVRMSPVNDTPAVEDNTQKGQPAAETPKKRKAEPETIDSKVRFYQVPDSHALMMNRRPPNHRGRRKRNRRIPTAYQMRPRLASR